MYDVLIIGAGPAGLSAALQLARSNRSVLVFDKGKQRALYAFNYRNYLGFPLGISGKELLELGKRQAELFGAKILAAEVTRVTKTTTGEFVVEANGQSYTGRRLIFATGVSDNLPKDIPGIMNFMGWSIFHCLDCDGYEFLNKKAIVFGAGKAAAAAALRVLSFTKDVFVATNGQKIDLDEQYAAQLQENQIEIVEDPISQLEGADHQIKKVHFANGSVREVDCGLTTSGSKPHNELALSLGVKTIPNGHILVDKDMKTNLDHVYAIGDIINSSQQVSLAVAEGVRAAIMINKTLLKDNQVVSQ